MMEMAVMFGLGLVSSLHCLQMCGPIVMAYSVSLSNPRRMMAAHAAYNGGRILTYMLLGAVAGTVGSGIGMLGRMAGMAAGARIVSGAAMIAMGVVLALPKSSLVQIGRPRVTQSIGRWITAPRPGSKFTLGLTLGFLPCGLIYAALLKSLESGSALSGSLNMLAFGLGTACALFAMGLASSFAGARLGPWSNRLAAVSVTLFGAILLWRGIAARPICHG
jgi:hypothetical protein